jgi:hypothetical protein
VGVRGNAGHGDYDDDSVGSLTLPPRLNEEREQRIHARKRRHLRQMSVQAFLFDGSFLLCYVSTFMLRWGVSGSYNIGGEDGWTSLKQEAEMQYDHYPLMILQAILLPLQGLLNMLVYVRPKYLTCRQLFSEESKIWAFRRAIFGSEIAPTVLSSEEGARSDARSNSISLEDGETRDERE